MWVDHSATSPCKDTIYVIWHNGDAGLHQPRAIRPAGTWAAPIQVSGAESTGTAIGGDVKTNSAGDVFGFWPTTSNRAIFVVKIDQRRCLLRHAGADRHAPSTATTSACRRSTAAAS